MVQDAAPEEGPNATFLKPLKTGQVNPGYADVWASQDRAWYNDLCIHHVRTWMESEIGARPLLEHAIERWRLRCEWFGMDGRDPQDMDERAFQVHLHRFLFDSGFDLNDATREAFTAYGRADFLIRGRAIVPVALKLWRTKTGLGDAPIRWAKQGTDYPIDLSVTAAYLVVVSAEREVRLDVADELRLPRVLRLRNVDLHVRVVDLGRRDSNEDGDRRVHLLKPEMLTPRLA